MSTGSFFRGFQKYLNTKILLGLVLFLGIVLRLYNLGTESYWLDEMSTVLEGQQSIQQLLASGRFDQPPAFYIPFHFWIQVFGTSEVGTRLFSVLAGIFSIGLIYMIGRELFGKEVGVLSAFFMAISEYQIYYSQTTRFYNFYVFTVLLSFLFFILALKHRKVIYYALYVIAGILMVYSHTYGILILVAQSLFIILQGKKYKNVIITWLICQALVLLAFAPYFLMLLFSEGGAEGAIYSNAGNLSIPSALDPLRALYRFILSPRRFRSWNWMLTNYAIAVVFLVISLWVSAVRQGKGYFPRAANELDADILAMKKEEIEKTILLCCWLLLPIILPFIFSFILFPLYKDEYVVGAAPALYLLMAFGVFSIRKLVPLVISLGIYAIMIVPSLGYYYVADINEQWPEVAEYVKNNSDPSDIVVVAPDMGNSGIHEKQQKLFNWYYQGNLQTCGLKSGLKYPDEISRALMQCISGHDRFWMIITDYPTEAADDPFRSFFLSSDQTAVNLIEEQQFVQISVYLFELVK